ncbi:MAG TPA: hypothetical protein VK420_01970 [Longimicrobium sp.]|nr:hypothetical protein [Longimicrobium sp.]
MSEPDVVMYYQVCGLCGERIYPEDLTSFWIPSRRLGNIEFNAHVSCLQRALHPRVGSMIDPEDVRLHPRPDS